MKFLIVFILFQILISSHFASAQKQNVDFTEANFSKKKKGLKSALRHLKIGYGVLEIDEDEASALKSFHRANKFNPNNSALNYHIGKCYLQQENPDLKLAIQYLEDARNLNPIADIKIYYDLAKAYHLSMQWDNAITHYKKYKELLGDKSKDWERKDLEKRIAECESGKILAHTPRRASIEHLGKQFNTRFYEASPVVSADEKVLIFTAKRDKSTGYEMSEDGTYFEDVYIATKGKGGTWAKVEKLNGVNSNGHDAIVSIAPNGKRLILYKGIQNGDLYAGTLEKGKVLDVRPLPSVFNTKFRESSACINAENNLVYFTSNRPNESQGGLDIWISQRDSNGIWQEAKNLGGNINSPFDEDGLCLMPDGKTLYFSSKGHNSIGGYDIFKTTFRNGEWSKPENIGLPINTPYDDVFVSVSQDGKRLYFSSYRNDSFGSYDLYMATLLGEPKEPELVKGDYLSTQEAIKLGLYTPNEDNLLLTNDLTLVKGIVIDPETGKPLAAQVIVSDNEKEKVVTKVESNPKTGEFEVTVPTGGNYGVAIKSEGRLLHSENIDTRNKEEKKIELADSKTITNTSEKKNKESTKVDNTLKNTEKVSINEKPKEVFLEVKPEKVAEGSSVRLNNIFFDVDKADLRKESTSELNHVVELMTEYPNMVVEVAGHTDNTGTAEHNMALSTERARSVLKYLVDKGIEKKRIVAVGYGMSKPLASNDTEEGKQSNRRTEFKIVKMK
jgi:outer membrane protein OmpA-like peptidoglycan-associated protein